MIQLSNQKENEYLLSCTHILWYLSRSEKTLTAEIADICLNLENKDLIFIIADKGMNGLSELVDQHLPVTRQSLFKIAEKIITNLPINTVKSEDATKETEAESTQAKLKNADDNSNPLENHSGGGCTIM